jgi:RHS repeat-associated protein
MTPHHQFLDLAGDGQLDCVVLERPLAGFFKRTEDRRWETFTPLPSLPNVDWGDPNLRFTDVDGDGHADILITEHEALTWHPSLAESGFGPAIRVPKPKNEDEGPTIIFADADQAIFLADMSGDGLADIVRIRNGEVCYWPNLGYGRFGKKITMDGSPWFDPQDLFDQRRIRLADIDGSGTTDIIYVAHDGVRLYFNQSGNRWSEPRALSVFPRVDDLASVQALDLLGNGTACLVWTSALPGDARHSMRYVDLMGGEKPHLLIGSRNNLGAQTRVFYAPSTKFYLADRAAGQPWVTRLPFPVHVVERVETYDRVSRNRFVTRYSYHHGFYDGLEREFRGFGRVDQLDTEELGALTESGVFPDAVNVDAASYVPPVMTKTWFHTGAFLDEARISRHLEDEYLRESDLSEGVAGLTDAEFEAMLLPDSVLPPDLTGDETPEAYRSLKGAILRQEVYALDGTDEADRPYSVSERNYTIKRLQPFGPNRHAVFFTHARESIDFHYERKLYDVNGRRLADPRVTHGMMLAVDAFGNELQSVAIGYGRRRDDPDPLLGPEDRPRQKKTHVTFSESSYTNPILEDDAYRAPLPAEARTFELLKVAPDRVVPDITNLFGFDEMAGKLVLAGDGAHDLPYEDIDAHSATAAHPYRRPIEHVRTLYRKNDLTGALPLGSVESLALPFESYRLAFTPGLLAVYRRGQDNLLPNPVPVLRDEAGYVLSADKKALGLFPSSDPDGQWWIPSGQVFYSPNAADTPAQKVANAIANFFLPRRFRDPFGHESTVRYDAPYDLLLLETEDALHNKVTVGERGANDSITNRNDYRVLQPSLITDPNGNRAEVAFDALGMVAGSAVMGKPAENLGDSLSGFIEDLTQNDLDQFFADPKGPSAATLLGRAATRIVYDLDRFAGSGTAASPVYAATIARETHVSDLEEGQLSKLQVSFSYSDGFGREIQKKIQAEPGPVIDGGPVIDPRWVGSGWTIFNNKGKPVRQYEPVFSQLPTQRHRFEFGVTVGVSRILFYDPVERVVATLHPNHSSEKVVFDPWRQETWDVNDTVLMADPRTDTAVGDFFSRLPNADYLPTWHALRTDVANAAAFAKRYPDPTDRANETRAAEKTRVHAATPAIAHVDSLGRTFLTVAHNKLKYSDTPPADPPVEEFHRTRIMLDIEGNQREVIDAKDRVIMRYDYDMLGNRVHQASMEAGERWMLNDVSGKPLYAWDSRNHRFRTAYDALRRPTDSFLRDGVGAETVVGRSVYGESRPNPEASNLRGKVVQLFDQAGVVTSDDYDFKGNLRRSQRQFAQSYKTTLDWSGVVPLQAEIYASRTRDDALNRPTQLIGPHSDQPGATVNVIQPIYNEANLLEQVHAWLNRNAAPAGWLDPATANLHAVTNIAYDAKGQRELIAYGNGAVTTYDYDPLTFRLVHLLTRRSAVVFPDDCPQPPPAGWLGCQVQNLHYTYDPAGNITHISDDAQQTIYFKNKRVEPSAEYTYDAIYRLIEATGREHLGQVGGPPIPHSYNDAPRVGLLHPNDGNAMGRYLERYIYDPVGNFEQMKHERTDAQVPGWTRSYAYTDASLIEVTKQSNRLTSTTIGGITETYSIGGDGYDTHGNMLHMPHLQVMQWDFKDQLQMTQRQAVNAADADGVQHQGERAYYLYDSGGQRARKVTERQNGTRKEECIYLAGFEIYRKYENDGDTVDLERETLHIIDGEQRVALVETRTKGNDGSPAQLIRYQFTNHLGSASLELDDTGRIISYEEYYPYGSTSYKAVDASIKAAAKRYRYTGMERDEETGLEYHHARYCILWLGRWTSCDPAGTLDGTNLYNYALNNPIAFRDPRGRQHEGGTIPVDWHKVDHPLHQAATDSERKGFAKALQRKHVSRSPDHKSVKDTLHELLHKPPRLPALDDLPKGPYKREPEEPLFESVQPDPWASKPDPETPEERPTRRDQPDAQASLLVGWDPTGTHLWWYAANLSLGFPHLTLYGYHRKKEGGSEDYQHWGPFYYNILSGTQGVVQYQGLLGKTPTSSGEPVYRSQFSVGAASNLLDVQLRWGKRALDINTQAQYLHQFLNIRKLILGSDPNFDRFASDKRTAEQFSLSVNLDFHVSDYFSILAAAGFLQYSTVGGGGWGGGWGLATVFVGLGVHTDPQLSP